MKSRASDCRSVRRTNKGRASLWALALGLGLTCWASLGQAQTIRIVKAGAQQIPIDLSEMRGADSRLGNAFLATVAEDLKRSGWFSIARSGEGAVAVQGEIQVAVASLKVNCSVYHSATRSPYMSKDYRDAADRVRRLAHQVADDIVFAVKKVPGIASSRIALVGRRGGRKDLYICDADGQNMTALTQNESSCLSLNWDPSGQRLVYTSFRSGYPDVYLLDISSHARKRLSGFPGLNSGADISPDGQTVALVLSKDGNPDVYLLDMGSCKLKGRVTQTKRDAEASPSWSPDGRSLVFVSDRSGSPQLFMASVSGGTARQLTFRGRENVSPDWGPDGRIVCSRRVEGAYQLVVIDPVAGTEEQLTTEYCDHEDPSWAPDGRHLVYTRTERYRSTVYVLDSLGGSSIRLTNIDAEWMSPAWSPK